MGSERNFDIDVRERPYAEALRIIADLHAAYGKGTELTMGRIGDSTQVSVSDASGLDAILIVRYYDDGRVSIDPPNGLLPDAYLPLTGVGAVRVWLHRYGGKR